MAYFFPHPGLGQVLSFSRKSVGRVGDPARIVTLDDFEVVSVDVVIRDAADAVLEQGPAALVDGKWTYAATTVVVAGETVTIEATAKDHPGNPGVKTMPWLIA